MKHNNRVFATTLGLTAALAMLVMGGLLVPAADADDTDLFRSSFGKPYLFIFFDTSSSVNNQPDQQRPVPANGDDPQSIFRSAKRVFHDVFTQVEADNPGAVHYGFASYNQDEMRIRGKHWLYEVAAGSPAVSFGVDGPTYPDPGELLVFGAHFPVETQGRTPDFSGGQGSMGPEQGDANGPEATDAGVLGNCSGFGTADIGDSIQRTQINRFSKLHPVAGATPGLVGSMIPTTLHIVSEGTLYKLVVSPKTGLVGDSTLTATFQLFDCADNPIGAPADVQLSEVQEFFYHEQVHPDDFSLHNPNSFEMTNGYWEYQDVQALATCGDDSPFGGLGWEGNYDGTFVSPDVNPIPALSDVDSFGDMPECPAGAADCNLRQPTDVYGQVHACHEPTEPEWRARDFGDLIPFDWENTNAEAFFRRLAPNRATSPANPDFGVATYFTDVPASDGFLRLKIPAQKPLTAFGGSPIGDALADWRCYYLGETQQGQGGHKCKQPNPAFGAGWDDLAAACDSEFGCRKVYQIIITDGENNCSGEDPAADAANLQRQRIESWVINFGGPLNSRLERLTNITGGEYVEVGDPQELEDELERIAGIILEDVRQFASAAAPQIQADDNDKVFNASFQPVDSLADVSPTAGVWPGRLDAFLKPVPIATDGTPDTSPAVACSTDPGVAPRANCHLWDATEQLVLQSTGLGNSADERRVFYSMLDGTRRMLEPTSGGGSDAYDLWRGMGLIPATMPDDGDSAANEALHETSANGALDRLYAIKTFDPESTTTGDEVEFVMGDIFHSEPLVVDQPEGVTYFRRNLFNDLDADDCNDDNPGYRCFFLKHQNRRKVMFFGANDGLLHALDAGIFRPEGHPSGFDLRYDDGTGREIFAYAPRAVLPTIHSQNSGGPRQWSVDASPNASDVFIDVGGPNGREWRTVLMTGLRRGGRGYAALDITQPDTYDDGIPEPDGSPDYVPSCINGGGGCGPIPYAAPLWEFTDSKLEPEDSSAGTPDRLVPFDEDLNGTPDLAATWSDPVLGLMYVCDDDGGDCDPNLNPENVSVRSVAIFGGGFSAEDTAGDWLYIVDVETGQAIYKQQLLVVENGVPTSAGSVPAEPAVVDVDTDGFIDRIYVGTRRGYVLRADLRDVNGNAPTLTPVATVPTTEAGVVALNVPRIQGPEFVPHEVFRAAATNDAIPPAARQIFYRPAAGFLSDLGEYAIAFGTGNREELFTQDGQPGRFYVVRDNIAVGDFVTRYSDVDLTLITDGVDGVLGTDTLAENSATQGWVLLTRANDRLITTPFQVAGITVFTMFEPDICVDSDGDGECDGGNENPKPNDPDPVCSRTGTSRVFAVNTRNADGLLFSDGTRIRGIDIAGFVVSPTIERAGTQNIYDPDNPAGGSTRPDDTPEDPSDDQDLRACEEDPDCMLALAEMQKLQPDNCKYSSQRHNLPLTTDLLVRVGEIPIPICIIDKNWVEL